MSACVLGCGFLLNWFVAIGVLAVVLLHVFRPFDFIASFLLTVAGATFVYYEGGRLTFELSLLTGAILLMLGCYWIQNRDNLVAFPRTSLTLPILAYVSLSLANFARGLLSGHPLKALFLELLPVLSIGASFMVAKGFDAKRDLRFIVVTLIGIAYGSAALGFYVFAIIHTHTSGVYFNATPGMIAMLLLNLALRARSIAATFVWIGVSLPLFLHQFLSFRRSLWVACIGALVASILVFTVRRGRSAWARVGIVLGTLLGIGVLGAVSLDVVYGQGDILKASVLRFTSIGATEVTYDTRSNFIRLAESTHVLNLIRHSPLVGYGLGYTFIVRIPMQGPSPPQFWMDENYLLIWLKQGLIGLVSYLWILWAAFRLGARQARAREDPWQSGWFAGLASSMVFMFLFSIFDWPFSQVNPTFLLALFSGVAMAMAHEGWVRVRWMPAPA